MNIEEYISSGVLEAYVLGDLSLPDKAEVEKNLADHPALRAELAIIEEAQRNLLMQAALKPNPSVKSRLLEKIDKPTSYSKIIPIAQSHATTLAVWRYAAAASFAVTLLSSYLAYTYRSKWKSTESNLNQLVAQNQRVAHDYNTVNQRLDKVENDVKVIDNPAFKRVIMKGTPHAPEATAYIYWNESSKEVYLSIQNLKKLSKENQYQLWAIIAGKPVDAGVFDPAVGGLLKMKDIGSGAATFAVTVEPRGGNSAPSLETMQVVGNVSKG